MKQILSKIKKSIVTYPWNRSQREATRCIRLIVGVCNHYAIHLNTTPTKVLEALENNRDYAALNYYQQHKFPKINKVDIVFETEVEAKEFIKDKVFECPACGHLGTDPYECSHEECDWKSYGLFGCLGKEFRIIIKENFLTNPKVHIIFKPVNKCTSSSVG